MHNKTYLTLAAFSISVIGWIIWNLFLSGIWSAANSRTFDIHHAFLDHFGKDLQWWLTLLYTLTAVLVFELGVQTAKKAFWPSDVDIWQELQKDPAMKSRVEETAEGKHRDVNEVGNVGDSREAERQREKEREDEIQQLLDRPRVMEPRTTESQELREGNGNGQIQRERPDVPAGPIGDGRIPGNRRQSAEVTESPERDEYCSSQASL